MLLFFNNKKITVVDNEKNEIFEIIIDGEEEETIPLEAKDIAELKVR